MKKEASLPVRLDPDEKRRLKAAAERMGLTVSAMVRLLVRSFVEDYERHDGHLSLPPDWADIFKRDVVALDKAAENSSSYSARARRRASR